MKRLWHWWKGVAKKIGDFQARFALSIFYFLILAPFALLFVKRKDVLTLKQGKQRGWQLRETPEPRSKDAALKQS